MAKTVEYMVTWTTYGTWLQGDSKGFVADGEVRGENIALKKSNVGNLTRAAVRLGRREKEIVRNAIIEADVVVGYYKNAGRVALQKNGFKGRVWTRRV